MGYYLMARYWKLPDEEQSAIMRRYGIGDKATLFELCSELLENIGQIYGDCAFKLEKNMSVR